MKNIKTIIVICISVVFISSCNKESIEQNSSAKQNEKKEALTESQNSEVKENKNTSSNLHLYKIDKVEKQSGKTVAPNFIWNEAGKEMSLNELKGNVVLVNLWATWCGPCIKEMPDLSKISEEMEGKNFKMLGMNVFQQDG